MLETLEAVAGGRGTNKDLVKLEELLEPREGHPEVVILDMTRLIQLDTTGLEGLENLRDKLHKRGCTLIVCGMNSQPGSLLFRSGSIDHLGDDNVCEDLSGALRRAWILLPTLMGGEDDH